ncbi:uncharacterized protein C3orf20 homolog [Tachyglossus aculeatus]|uniref:uncharacterized protein C3orf20 homolog n=1 Tax=Tachyglossus aculeatus TaxID=9261 RepID=UPI0018F3D9C7|nr:uncharacterized protein C3orf20 homolog [Tachyglossus aculeatus]
MLSEEASIDLEEKEDPEPESYESCEEEQVLYAAKVRLSKLESSNLTCSVNNPELYEQYKAMAPKLLAELSCLLAMCRRLGKRVPQGIKNVFEFTWEELSMLPPRTPPSNSFIPVISLGPALQYSPSLSSVGLTKKVETVSSASSPTNSAPYSENQELLFKFQQGAINLLTELLTLKLKALVEPAAGPSAKDITRRFIQATQILNLRKKTEEHRLSTVRKKGSHFSILSSPHGPSHLIYQTSSTCLSVTLSSKGKKKKSSVGDSHWASNLGEIWHFSSISFKPPINLPNTENLQCTDPCPEARKMLQEMCQKIEKEKASLNQKSFPKPVILQNYFQHMPLRKHSVPKEEHNVSVDLKTLRSLKFYYSFSDGTTFVYYPSGNVAVSQIPTCCSGRLITFIYEDAPSFALLAVFTSEGLANVQYSFTDQPIFYPRDSTSSQGSQLLMVHGSIPTNNSFPFAVMMDFEGGTARDSYGQVTHSWNWASKMHTLQTLKFQLNEQLTLRVLNQKSMTLTFKCLGESVTLSLSATDCPHGVSLEKQVLIRNRSFEIKNNLLNRTLTAVKKQFQKTLKQFINCILKAAGLLTIKYPVKDEIDLSKFKKKEVSHLEWARRKPYFPGFLPSRPEIPVEPSALQSPVRKKSLSPQPQLRASSNILPILEKATIPTQAASSDCPVVLRKIIRKEDISSGCKCLVKMPIITDLEFEKFISAPRESSQILVICVLASQKPAYSLALELIFEDLYVSTQFGRSSPCIQSKHDPYRLLKYDLDNQLEDKPPLLLQKHAVVPGMVLIFANGKLLFGSNILNGYGWSKKHLLKQIARSRQDCQMGRYLPDGFNFSTLSPFMQRYDKWKSLRGIKPISDQHSTVDQERPLAIGWSKSSLGPMEQSLSLRKMSMLKELEAQPKCLPESPQELPAEISFQSVPQKKKQAHKKSGKPRKKKVRTKKS